MTLMFLSHLDNPRYKLAVKECEAAIPHSPTIPMIYMVPETAGTIDQLRPTTPNDPASKPAQRKFLPVMPRRARKNPRSSVPSDEAVADHPSDVAEGAIAV